MADDKELYSAAGHASERPPLPPDAESRVIAEARKEGVFAGLTSGLASAIMGQRLLRFNRNKTIFCGVLTAFLSGYYFTQAFTSTAIAQLRAEEARLASGYHPSPSPANPHPFETRAQEK